MCLSYHWVLDDEIIRVLVAKAHKIVNVRPPKMVDATLVRSLITWITTPETMTSLLVLLNDFRDAFLKRAEEDSQHKRANIRYDGSPTPQSRRPTGSAPDIPLEYMHKCVSALLELSPSDLFSFQVAMPRLPHQDDSASATFTGAFRWAT